MPVEAQMAPDSIYRSTEGLGVWEHKGKVAAVGIGISPTARRWDETADTSVGAWTILAIQRAIEDAGRLTGPGGRVGPHSGDLHRVSLARGQAHSGGLPQYLSVHGRPTGRRRQTELGVDSQEHAGVDQHQVRHVRPNMYVQRAGGRRAGRGRGPHQHLPCGEGLAQLRWPVLRGTGGGCRRDHRRARQVDRHVGGPWPATQRP